MSAGQWNRMHISCTLFVVQALNLDLHFFAKKSLARLSVD